MTTSNRGDIKKKRLTLSNQPAGTNPLDNVHTDEGDQHQGNGQLAEMIESHSSVHLHLQHDQMRRPMLASITSQTCRRCWLSVL